MIDTEHSPELDLEDKSIERAKDIKDINYANDFHGSLLYPTPSLEACKTMDEILLSQDPYEVTNIQFTSGTTGLPKASVLTHHNIMNNGIGLANIMDYSPEERICMPVPFYHCFGMVMGNLAAMSRGSAIVISSPTFNGAKTLDTIEKHACTTVYGVPTMFIEMIKAQNVKTRDLAWLRKSVIAGSVCPEQLLKDKTTHLNISKVHVAYGMTETSPVSFMIREDSPAEKKCVSVGQIMEHVEAKIIDEEWNTVPVGENGELVVRGYSVMKGYYRDPVNTEKNVHDGWMMTGDLAKLDQDGFLSIEGRLKDLIIRGGENIAPFEIEESIMSLGIVENVQVIGVPDEKYQEEICALVKFKSGNWVSKETIAEHVKGQLAHFKVPKYVQFVEDFPITVTGKPQKFRMRDEWVAMISKMTEEEVKRQFVVR